MDEYLRIMCGRKGKIIFIAFILFAFCARLQNNKQKCFMDTDAFG